MKTIFVQRWVISLSALLACTGAVWGYPVGYPVSLGEITKEADIIFKGTAVSTGPVQDDWFKPYSDFVACETLFKVISVIKGESPGSELLFRHYDEVNKGRSPGPWAQYYHFEIGNTYLQFAKSGGTPGVFRQLWTGEKTKKDQGVLLCVDDKPLVAKTAKDAVWSELMGMLGSFSDSNVTYAIGQLNQMSCRKEVIGGLSDFDRKDVLVAVRGLLTNPNSKIAQAAIGLVGSYSPYISDKDAILWIGTVGRVKVPGFISMMDPMLRNVGGELCSKDLIQLVDSQASKETRALAIRALGLVREPTLEEPIIRWLADPVPDIRASTTLLLADFPGPEKWRRLTAMATDSSTEVRVCVAHAVGFGQMVEMADVLARLLADKESKVRQAAAMSLLSFSPQDEAIARIFRANIDNAEYKPLFLNALARGNPGDYLDALSKVVIEKTEPKYTLCGQIPAFTAWEILFKYLQGLPVDKISSGKFDRYLDAMEKVGDYSSSEPRDIYAFYVQRGMSERAMKFRQEANKVASYDIDQYFKQVDENPSLYKRE